MSRIQRSVAVLAIGLFTVTCCKSAVSQGIDVRLTSRTTLRVWAQQSSSTLPANRDLRAGVNLGAAASGASADLSTLLNHTAKQTKFELRESGRGSPSLLTGSEAGPHTIRMVLRARIPVRATLDVVMTFRASRGAMNAFALNKVTAGNQTVYLNARSQASVRRRIPIVVDSRGFVIDCSTNASARYGFLGGNFAAALTLTLTPVPPCAATAFGTSCGGTSATGVAYATREIDFRLARGFASAPGLFVIGLQRDNARIPRTPCIVYTKIALQLPFTSDASGAAKLLLALPSGVAATFQWQAATFRVASTGLQLAATNGIEVVCTR